MDGKKVLERTKKVLALGSGIGAGAIVAAAVKTNVPTSGMNFLMKACVGLGTFALGDWISNKASDQMDGFVDEAIETARTIVAEIENPTTTEFVEA